MGARFPVQIDSFKYDPLPEYDDEDFIRILRECVRAAIDKSKKPGIFLSGGIDSSILARIARDVKPAVKFFVIGQSSVHPDVIAAMKLADEFDLDLRVYLPVRAIRDVYYKYYGGLPGDGGVMAVMKEAKKQGVTDIIATDGIDEQMGGYWYHTHWEDQFDSLEQAFIYFWDKLEVEHLSPMWESAKILKVNVNWIFLHPAIVDFISHIPLECRTKENESKCYWRHIATLLGVPQWILERPKVGFVDALAERHYV